MTFYDFPQTLHRSIRTTNAIESLWSLVRQRTDQIDVFTRRVELPDDRLGDDPGYSTAQSPGRIDRVLAKGGAAHNST
jgi:hypothetical protein